MAFVNRNNNACKEHTKQSDGLEKSEEGLQKQNIGGTKDQRSSKEYKQGVGFKPLWTFYTFWNFLTFRPMGWDIIMGFKRGGSHVDSAKSGLENRFWHSVSEIGISYSDGIVDRNQYN